MSIKKNVDIRRIVVMNGWKRSFWRGWSSWLICIFCIWLILCIFCISYIFLNGFCIRCIKYSFIIWYIAFIWRVMAGMRRFVSVMWIGSIFVMVLFGWIGFWMLVSFFFVRENFCWRGWCLGWWRVWLALCNPNLRPFCIQFGFHCSLNGSVPAAGPQQQQAAVQSNMASNWVAGFAV